jgi:hypothetical protein
MQDISWGISEYSILSERYIIHSVPGADYSTQALRVYDLDRGAVGGSLLCSLPFPKLGDFPAHAYGWSRHLICCDLTSGRTSHPSHTVPFSPSQNDRLYVIRCDRDPDPFSTTVLFVPLSTFMAVIDALNVGEAPHTLPWNEWREKGTCMLNLLHHWKSFAWIDSVHAMKLALVWGQQIKIFDFNQCSFKYDHLKEESEYLTDSSVFRELIPSSLDYRIRVAQMPLECDPRPSFYPSVLLTEDSLIMISVSFKVPHFPRHSLFVFHSQGTKWRLRAPHFLKQ